MVDVKWHPQSDVMSRGMPKWATPPREKVRAHSLVEMLTMGQVSGHFEVLSTTVSR